MQDLNEKEELLKEPQANEDTEQSNAAIDTAVDPDAPVDNLDLAHQRIETVKENVTRHSGKMERFHAKGALNTERRIAKAQSEIAQSVKRASINADTRSAELGYGYEYRKKLIEENARREEEERRIREENEKSELEAERKMREEEALRLSESEEETVSKGSEESDALINGAIQQLENVNDSETEPSDAANTQTESVPSAENESVTLQINEQEPVNSDNVLYIPAQSLYIPLPQYPLYQQAPNADAMARMWSERSERLKAEMDECLARIADADQASSAIYEGQLASIREAAEALERERRQYESQAGDVGAQYCEPKTEPDADTFVGMSDDERTIQEYEKYINQKCGYSDPLDQTPDTDAELDRVKSEGGLEIDEASFALSEKDAILRIKKIDKDAKKSIRREERAHGLAAVTLYNSRLALEKEALELLINMLSLSVRVESKPKIKQFKKLLTRRIASYNLLILDFNLRTGRDLPLLSSAMPKNIILGKGYQAPPDLALNTDSVSDVQIIPTVSKKELKRAQKDELRRAAIADKELERLQKTLKKNGFGLNNLNAFENAELSALMQKISEQRSRDEAMLEARYNYLILKGQTDKDLNRYTFGTRRKNCDEGVKRASKLVKQTKSKRKAALKLEKLDNDRYYEILALDAAKTVYKRKRADREKLASVRTQMDLLLEKRDVINKRLYMLYLGKAYGDKRGMEKKYNAAAREGAKKAYKKQLKLYKIMEKEHLPLDMKENLYKLMNQKTALYSRFCELGVRLKGAKGIEAKEMKRERKTIVNNIKALNENIDYYFKRKVNRRIEKNRTKRTQLLWLFALILIIGAGYLVYRFYGARILEFVKSYIQGLLNKGGNG